MNIEKLIKVVKLTKRTSVGDSDKLKQMAYKFAQMGNYFDRANSMESRNILAKEDDKKYPEFYSYALQVYQQLKNEVERMKKASPTAKPYFWRGFDNETLKLLEDGMNRLYWAPENMRDDKGKALAKKFEALIKEYKNTAYDSVKAKDARAVTVSGWQFRDNELIKQHKDALTLLNEKNLKDGKKQLDYYLHNVRECLDQAIELEQYAKSRQAMYKQLIDDVDKDRTQFNI